MLFEAAAAIWAIGDGFEAAALSLPLKIFWSQIAYIGISMSAVMFFLFAYCYTSNSANINPYVLTVILIIPVSTILVAFTNSSHHLLWTEVKIIEGTNQGAYFYGPWFWINVFYEYSLLTAGLIILGINTFRVFRYHRTQYLILILGGILPFIASISYIFKLAPGLKLDPTPISFVLSGIVVAISLYRFRLFNIVPIARQQAINDLSVGLLFIDTLGHIIEVNPYFLKIINSKSDQLIGVAADSILSRFNLNLAMFSEEDEFTCEAAFDVSPFKSYFEVKCHQILNIDKTIAGQILMFSDITTKKMILETIADSNKRQKRELIEKEKLIKDLDAYARSVAHDLKNPVSVLHGMAQIIIRDISVNKTASILKHAELIKDQCEKMIRITDNLLMLSRIRKQDVVLMPVDLKSVEEQVLARLKYDIESRNARIITPEKWPIVLGNEQLLEEVFVNLISNGLKYGGIPPVIKISYKNESETLYRILVSDNGAGLSSESLAKLFIDFERLGREDIQGHGLGLTIVKRIIDKLGGVVTADSKNIPGEGCVFSFTLQANL